MDREFQFKNEFDMHIKRDGVRQLLGWLFDSDFFTAPASTKYHSACPGGLLKHSLCTFYRLRDLWISENGMENLTPEIMESLAICGLLHDICKANFYTVDFRKVKNDDTGVWEKKPYYAVKDELPYGHGEKSVYIISQFMKLTEEEAMAIRWHMGAYGDDAKSPALQVATRKYPLVLMLQMADMMASNWDEEEGLMLE